MKEWLLRRGDRLPYIYVMCVYDTMYDYLYSNCNKVWVYQEDRKSSHRNLTPVHTNTMPRQNYPCIVDQK